MQMERTKHPDPTTTVPTLASDRAALIRARVRAALEAGGDPRGEWAAIARLLDEEHDALRRRAGEERQLAFDVIDEASS